MEFAPFSDRYYRLAHEELRIITITADDLGVPLGGYYLLESYCIDDSCDCRKVMINFIETAPSHRILATIGYGWETEKFYTDWMFGDKEMGKLLIGAYLELGGIQSEYSQNFLEIFTTRLTQEYIETIKRHYALFKKHKTDEKSKKNTVIQDKDVRAIDLFSDFLTFLEWLSKQPIKRTQNG